MIKLNAEIAPKDFSAELKSITSNYSSIGADISQVIARDNVSPYVYSAITNTGYATNGYYFAYPNIETLLNYVSETIDYSIGGNKLSNFYLVSPSVSFKGQEEEYFIYDILYKVKQYSNSTNYISYNTTAEYSIKKVKFSINGSENPSLISTYGIPPTVATSQSSATKQLTILVRTRVNSSLLTPLRIELQGKSISKLNIVFDKTNDDYAPEIIFNIGGETKTILFNSADSIVEFDETVDSLTMDIYKWSRMFGRFTLTNINTVYPLSIKQLQGVSYSHQRQSNNELPSWGIISNSGKLRFNDMSGEILELIESGELNDDLNCKIFLTNTLAKKSEQLVDCKTAKWLYDNDNRVVNVELKDDLEEWQDIYIEGLNYDPRYTQGKTMEDIYKYLHGLTPSKYNMMSFDELAPNTKSQLTNTLCKYPIIKQGTLWQSWYKLCQVCQLYIYKNELNQTMCSYDLGA